MGADTAIKATTTNNNNSNTKTIIITAVFWLSTPEYYQHQGQANENI